MDCGVGSNKGLKHCRGSQKPWRPEGSNSRWNVHQSEPTPMSSDRSFGYGKVDRGAPTVKTTFVRRDNFSDETQRANESQNPHVKKTSGQNQLGTTRESNRVENDPIHVEVGHESVCVRCRKREITG